MWSHVERIVSLHLAFSVEEVWFSTCLLLIVESGCHRNVNLTDSDQSLPTDDFWFHEMATKKIKMAIELTEEWNM